MDRLGARSGPWVMLAERKRLDVVMEILFIKGQMGPCLSDTRAHFNGTSQRGRRCCLSMYGYYTMLLPSLRARLMSRMSETTSSARIPVEITGQIRMYKVSSNFILKLL